MTKLIDLTGKRYGRLLVLDRDGANHMGYSTWTCRCDCGVEKIYVGANLRSGDTKSCGCLHRDNVRIRSTKHHHAHAGAISSTYRTWSSMCNRCTKPKNKRWSHYGGRGIRVCDRWLDSFANFLADMGEKPHNECVSIERINNDGHYEPGNCKWADVVTQANNTSRNRFLEFRCAFKRVASQPSASQSRESGSRPRSSHLPTLRDTGLCTRRLRYRQKAKAR